jgi:dynein heavy chain
MVGKFNKHIPLIRCLSNNAMQDRHWKRINEACDSTIHPVTEPLQLRNVIQMDFKDHMDILEECSETASREYTIQRAIEEMEGAWDGIAVGLAPVEDTDTFLVKGDSVEEAALILDDQLIQTQTMKGSTYARIFKKKITKWEDWLEFTIDFFELWIKVQNQWRYLQPVFASEDIKRQMPGEANKFDEVDKMWRKLMQNINENKIVRVFTENRSFLDDLNLCFEYIEKVNRGLNGYIEGKQVLFPRFFFLSKDDLLDILK